MIKRWWMIWPSVKEIKWAWMMIVRRRANQKHLLDVQAAKRAAVETMLKALYGVDR